MRVLVTGATGFVGRSVVTQLLEAGHQVAALTRDRARAGMLPTSGVTVVRGDVLDASSLVPACQGADAIIHLVAVIRETGRDKTFARVNVEGTRNVMSAWRVLWSVDTLQGTASRKQPMHWGHRCARYSATGCAPGPGYAKI